MHGPAQQMVARPLNRIEGAVCFKHSCVIVSVIADNFDPLGRLHFHRYIRTTRKRSIRVEKVSPKWTAATRWKRNVAREAGRTRFETDDVIKTVVEILSGKTDAVL